MDAIVLDKYWKDVLQTFKGEDLKDNYNRCRKKNVKNYLCFFIMIKHLTFFHIEVLSNLSCNKKNKLIISDRKSIFTRIKFSNPSQLFHSLVKQNPNIFSCNRIKYNVK